jgi:dTDP-4-amino-4,6-dideoxygalactose transaminase
MLSKPNRPIAFIDLKAQQARLGPAVTTAMQNVLAHGAYIMGPEVRMLEEQLAEYCGVKHAITCANGTDALSLGLMALQVRPQDVIFVPSFTFAATAEIVAEAGAIPFFVDVLPDTYNIDPDSLLQAIAIAKRDGMRPVGMIPVDLFGQPADYAVLQEIATQHGLWIMADSAQSFGATYQGKRTGSIASLTTTSFFPAKPLGCYGDGGAIFTDNDALATTLRSIRVHGQGSDKYDNIRIGRNSRLDTLQAAILIEKLAIFDEEIIARQALAEYYTTALQPYVVTPHVIAGATSVWAQYTLLLPETTNRAEWMQTLKNAGIPTMVYYGKPLHQQSAYAHFPRVHSAGLAVSEDLAARVVSLPMHPYLYADAPYIVTQVIAALQNSHVASANAAV